MNIEEWIINNIYNKNQQEYYIGKLYIDALTSFFKIQKGILLHDLIIKFFKPMPGKSEIIIKFNNAIDNLIKNGLIIKIVKNQTIYYKISKQVIIEREREKKLNRILN